MNVKEKIQSVLEALGFTQKFAKNKLTSEEFNSLVVEYQKKYKSTLQDDMAAEDSAKQQAEQAQQQQQFLNQVQALVTGDETTEDTDPAQGEQTASSAENATPTSILHSVKTLKDNFNTLAAQPAVDAPVSQAAVTPLNINGFGDTKQYLFGVENKLFDMSTRWNKIAHNPRCVNNMPDVDEEGDGKAFYAATKDYSKSLFQRYTFLAQNHMLDAKGLAAGTYSTNYDGVDSAGVGNQFVVLRQDALLARVIANRDVTQFFPVAYGYQDRALVFNSYFSEVSQAYQEGEVFKGSMNIENQMGYVDDAMIKLNWGSMKDLERKYIGYLNKEGSDPIKWTMIEYCLLNSLLTAQAEQNKRRMRGIYVKPEAGTPGSYLNAGTGLLYTLLRYKHEYSIKPHDDVDGSYRSYTESTMLDAVLEFISDVQTTVSEDTDLDQHVIYLNKNHRPWWIKCLRKAYGKDTDFSGTDSYANVVPDTNTKIIWLPYLGKLTLMFMQVPGNIQFLENLPGEMMNMKLEERMEVVRAWATWKEGTSAAFTGKRFSNQADLDENSYAMQQIFMNMPVTSILATVDANNGFWQIIDSKTTITDITDIANAKAGVAYCIEVADASKNVSISKAVKFANITAEWKPKKVGDYILVTIASDGTFLELERCVDGTRIINQKLQPNVPGGR